jgi:hypothetical protein
MAFNPTAIALNPDAEGPLPIAIAVLPADASEPTATPVVLFAIAC